jgi:hypothetical protein
MSTTTYKRAERLGKGFAYLQIVKNNESAVNYL